jgi:phage major head subunit gpT-like protein
MGILTPDFLFSLEDGMRVITENEYARMMLSENLWYKSVTKERPSSSRKELLFWLLSTAQITDEGGGGNMRFEDLVTIKTEYENKDSGAGFEVPVNEFGDLDGNGINLAQKWSGDIGAYMAYWPQQQIASLIAAGETNLAYDAQAFFSKAHPLNPFRTSVGTYGNLFSSSYNGSSNPTYYAAPIDSSVAVDVAVNNLARVYATIRAIKMPNGVTPRFLKPSKILVPSELVARAQEITKAKYIAQAAGTYGGGSADIESIISKWGFEEPAEIQEFAGVDATSYYIVAREAGTSELGAMVYQNREPFRITYYTGQGGGTGVDAILDRAKKLEWHCWGRNVAGYGHPFMLFKVKAS